MLSYEFMEQTEEIEIPKLGERFPEKIALKLDCDTKELWLTLKAHRVDVSAVARRALARELKKVLDQLQSAS